MRKRLQASNFSRMFYHPEIRVCSFLVFKAASRRSHSKYCIQKKQTREAKKEKKNWDFIALTFSTKSNWKQNLCRRAHLIINWDSFANIAQYTFSLSNFFFSCDERNWIEINFECLWTWKSADSARQDNSIHNTGTTNIIC